MNRVHLLKNKKILLCLLGIFLFMGGISSSAFADAGSYSDNGDDPFAMFGLMISVGSEIWYTIKISLLISGVLGIVLIIIGLLKIRASGVEGGGSNSHLKHGIILLILGGLLFGTPTLMMLGGYSLFGTAPAAIATDADT